MNLPAQIVGGIVTGASVSLGAWLVGRHIIKHLDAEKKVKRDDDG